MKRKKYSLIMVISVLLNLILAFFLVKNKDFEKDLSGIEYQAIVLPKNDKILLGEEYLAAVYIAVSDTINTPTLFVTDSVEKRDLSLDLLTDTIVFNKSYNTFIYSFTPKTKGEYSWGGKFLYLNGNKLDSLYFLSSYLVE